MKILVNLPPGFFKQAELQPCFARLEKHGPVLRRSHNTAEEIRHDLAEAGALLMWSWPALDEALLNAAPQLKFRGHIDLSRRDARLALQRKITVSLSRGGFSPAVSEMALALTLNLLRRVSDYHGRMRSGAEHWARAFPDDIDARERQLTHREVAIIGCGAVGRRLAELLRPFQTRLKIVDPFVAAETIAQCGGTRVELREALAGSDVVVLCAASNAGTSHFIGKKEIALFRKNAVFINVARAALVDTAALMDRLKRGDFFAALDVFDKEPLEKDAALRGLSNVYLTPHRGGGLISSVERVIGWLVDDFEAFVEGRPLAHPLTENMLPGLDD